MSVHVLEVWSPLKWAGVRFFVDEEGSWFVRVGKKPRRRVARRHGFPHPEGAWRRPPVMGARDQAERGSRRGPRAPI